MRYRENIGFVLARFSLAALLLAMAFGQISDLSGFVEIMKTYEVGEDTIAYALTMFLILGELLGGLGLLVANVGQERWRLYSGGAALGVAFVWSFLALQAFARGLNVPNCGCFGVHLAQPLGGGVLVQDAIFIGWATAAFMGTYFAFRDAQSPRRPARS
jgi:hypothetical protein